MKVDELAIKYDAATSFMAWGGLIIFVGLGMLVGYALCIAVMQAHYPGAWDAYKFALQAPVPDGSLPTMESMVSASGMLTAMLGLIIMIFGWIKLSELPRKAKVLFHEAEMEKARHKLGEMLQEEQL